MSIPMVFFDIDTQVDFMLPEGNLYVPGAEKIIPNLVRLMSVARERDIPVVSSADAHSPDDPEFAIWPPHCVVGTPGQKRIPETQFEDATIVPCRPGAFTPPQRWIGQTILEKPTYDTADNPNFDAILKSLGNRRAVVFGVATEFCVRADALALRQREQAVDLVVDCIKAITEEGGQKALSELASSGVRMVTTEEVISAARG
ncbi:MAG: cysteine hydrolase [Acidobacteria bacterium]|nr:cysteine hydrolase [Acidobacteriota bacterium]